MGTRITATFTITGWDATVYEEAGEAPALAQATLTKTFEGALSGTGAVRMLTSGQTGYIAMERIVGSIGERSGSFDVEHGGIVRASGQHTFGFVVPGSGTGDLRGIVGEIRYSHDESGAIVTLDYDFE